MSQSALLVLGERGGCTGAEQPSHPQRVSAVAALNRKDWAPKLLHVHSLDLILVVVFWPTVGLVAVRKRFEGKSYEGLLRAIRSLHPCTSVSHLHVPLSTSAKSFVA